MTESTRILTAQEFTNEDRRYLSLLKNANDYQTDYFCFPKFDLVGNVSYFRKQTIHAHTVKICTLGEDRWSNKMMRPYYGDGTFPGENIGDLWDDYQFDVPTTTQMKSELSPAKDLKETRKQENCPECRSNNVNNQCDLCDNTSFLTTWYQITARWTNEESTMIDISYEPCLVPLSIIRQATDFDVRFQFDDVWSANEKSLDSVLDTCPNLSQQLRNKINHAFLCNHYQKAKPIRRLSLTIHHYPIVQCQYQLRHLPGRTFTFCICGKNGRLYTTEESFPSTYQQMTIRCKIC